MSKRNGNQISSPERRTACTAFRNLYKLATNIHYLELTPCNKSEGTKASFTLQGFEKSCELWILPEQDPSFIMSLHTYPGLNPFPAVLFDIFYIRTQELCRIPIYSSYSCWLKSHAQAQQVSSLHRKTESFMLENSEFADEWLKWSFCWQKFSLQRTMKVCFKDGLANSLTLHLLSLLLRLSPSLTLPITSLPSLHCLHVRGLFVFLHLYPMINPSTQTGITSFTRLLFAALPILWLCCDFHVNLGDSSISRITENSAAETGRQLSLPNTPFCTIKTSSD